MVLGPEQKMPDGNLQLCVIDSFLFGIRLKPVTDIYHIVLLVLCSIKNCLHFPQDFPVAQLVKNPPAVQETTCNAEDPGSIPGLGRCPGEGNGNPR